MRSKPSHTQRASSMHIHHHHRKEHDATYITRNQLHHVPAELGPPTLCACCALRALRTACRNIHRGSAAAFAADAQALSWAQQLLVSASTAQSPPPGLSQHCKLFECKLPMQMRLRCHSTAHDIHAVHWQLPMRQPTACQTLRRELAALNLCGCCYAV